MNVHRNRRGNTRRSGAGRRLKLHGPTGSDRARRSTHFASGICRENALASPCVLRSEIGQRHPGRERPPERGRGQIAGPGGGSLTSLLTVLPPRRGGKKRRPPGRSGGDADSDNALERRWLAGASPVSIAALCVVTAIRGAHNQGDNAALGQRHPHRHPASLGSTPCNQGRKGDEQLCRIRHRRTSQLTTARSEGPGSQRW
jgi:hypothetical protein